MSWRIIFLFACNKDDIWKSGEVVCFSAAAAEEMKDRLIAYGEGDLQEAPKFGDKDVLMYRGQPVARGGVCHVYVQPVSIPNPPVQFVDEFKKLI
jgi:hypothetical protein